VLFALGEVFGGMSLVIEGAQLTLLYNGFGQFHRLGPVAVAAGATVFSLEVQALGKRRGRGRLLIDRTPVTDFSELSPTLRYGFHEGLDIGIDRRAPVDWSLFQRKGNFRYTGRIIELVIESGAFSPD
jgi:arylsulfatase